MREPDTVVLSRRDTLRGDPVTQTLAARTLTNPPTPTEQQQP